MYILSVERVSGISGMRRVLARQHVSPDGSLTMFGNLPFDREPDLTLEDDSEEPGYGPSGYSLNVSRPSDNKMKHRDPANR
jgi:hypothetical protein